MDAAAFLAKQAELQERLRHAVPRSARAKKLLAELKGLMSEQLRAELGGEAPAEPPAPIREPSEDFLRRTGDHTPPGLYGDKTPYWVDH